MITSRKRQKFNEKNIKELDSVIVRKKLIENRIVSLMEKALDDGMQDVVLGYAKQTALGYSKRECLLRTAANL